MQITKLLLKIKFNLVRNCFESLSKMLPWDLSLSTKHAILPHNLNVWAFKPYEISNRKNKTSTITDSFTNLKTCAK